jgi:excisionase family DNA binding protein
MSEQESLALTAEEASRELKISICTLYRLVQEGKIPAIRLGTRKYLFSRDELRKLLAQKQPPNDRTSKH